MTTDSFPTRPRTRSGSIAPMDPNMIHDRVLELLGSGGIDQIKSLINTRGSIMKPETLALLTDRPEFEGHFDLPLA